MGIYRMELLLRKSTAIVAILLSFLTAHISTVDALPIDICHLSSSVCSNVRIDPADAAVLLAFKSSVYSQYVSFADWKTNYTCSNGWTGVCTDSAGKVTEISFSLLYLNGVLPTNFGKLSKLQYLDLRASSFPYLPSTFGSLTSLKYLDMGYNLLNETSIPQVKKLTQLTYLDLSYNHIWGGFPALDGLKGLEYLDFSGNYLSGSIPLTFGGFKNLSAIYATVNNLCGTVPSYLGTLPKLQNLSFADNFLVGPLSAGIQNRFCDSFEGNCINFSTNACSVSGYPSYHCLTGCTPIPNLEKDLAYNYGSSNQSSSTVPFSSINAIDGSAGFGIFALHSCTQTLNETNPHFMVDLSNPYPIATVQLYNRLDCCGALLNGVQVYVGSSGDEFDGDGNTACTSPNYIYSKTNLGFPLTVKCNRQGRYVWVVIPGVNRTLSLCEVAVFGS